MSFKDYDPSNKVIQPKQKELKTLKSLQVLVESKPKEVTMIYKKYLLETPAFKRVGDKFNLFDQPNKLTRPCKDVDVLLDQLSMEFYHFFSVERTKAEWPLSAYGDRIAQSINTLMDCKEMFLAAGVKEKSFLQTMRKIDKMFKRVLKHIYRSVNPSKRSELVGALYYKFKELTTLSDDGVYYNIAIFFKHLGIEQGDIKKIFQRIKRDFIRKGKPQK